MALRVGIEDKISSEYSLHMSVVDRKLLGQKARPIYALDEPRTRPLSGMYVIALHALRQDLLGTILGMEVQ